MCDDEVGSAQSITVSVHVAESSDIHVLPDIIEQEGPILQMI